MRKETMMLSERNIMFCIAGQLYDQAPNRSPRKADIIMQKVLQNFRNDVRTANDNEYRTIRIPKNEVEKFIRSLLEPVSEFHELNLSQIEYENNVSVDDENRPKFAFTSAFDKETPDSWKYDFIDLDAFIQNVACRIFDITDCDADCFLCKYQPKNAESTLDSGNGDMCKDCCVRPTLKNNYTSCREPKGGYTIACKYDCYCSRYICCDECADRDVCSHKCDATHESCGQCIERSKGETKYRVQALVRRIFSRKRMRG